MKTQKVVANFPSIAGSLIEEILQTMEDGVNNDFLSELPPFDKKTDLKEVSPFNELEIALQYLASHYASLKKSLSPNWRKKSAI